MSWDKSLADRYKEWSGTEELSVVLGCGPGKILMRPCRLQERADGLVIATVQVKELAEAIPPYPHLPSISSC